MPNERPDGDGSDPAMILTADDLANALLRTFLRNADAHRNGTNDELVAEIIAWKRRRRG